MQCICFDQRLLPTCLGGGGMLNVQIYVLICTNYWSADGHGDNYGDDDIHFRMMVKCQY